MGWPSTFRQRRRVLSEDEFGELLGTLDRGEMPCAVGNMEPRIRANGRPALALQTSVRIADRRTTRCR